MTDQSSVFVTCFHPNVMSLSGLGLFVLLFKFSFVSAVGSVAGFFICSFVLHSF